MPETSSESSQPGTSSSDFSFSSTSSETTTSGYADIFGPADQEVERVQGIATSPNSLAAPATEPDMQEPPPTRVAPLPWQREIAVLEVSNERRPKPQVLRASSSQNVMPSKAQVPVSLCVHVGMPGKARDSLDTGTLKTHKWSKPVYAQPSQSRRALLGTPHFQKLIALYPLLAPSIVGCTGALTLVPQAFHMLCSAHASGFASNTSHVAGPPLSASLLVTGRRSRCTEATVVTCTDDRQCK